MESTCSRGGECGLRVKVSFSVKATASWKYLVGDADCLRRTKPDKEAAFTGMMKRHEVCFSVEVVLFLEPIYHSGSLREARKCRILHRNAKYDPEVADWPFGPKFPDDWARYLLAAYALSTTGRLALTCRKITSVTRRRVRWLWRELGACTPAAATAKPRGLLTAGIF